MLSFQDTFETSEKPFISDFSVCMTVTLMFLSPLVDCKLILSKFSATRS